MYRRTSSPSASPRLLPLWATQIALFSPQPLKAFATAVHRLPCSPPHRPIPASAQKQHHKSVIERSKQSSVHTLMHKKKDRVSSAGSRQSQRAGPTRACAAPASNPLGVSSKIVITMKRMQHFGRASSQPCDPAILVRSIQPLALHQSSAVPLGHASPDPPRMATRVLQ